MRRHKWARVDVGVAHLATLAALGMFQKKKYDAGNRNFREKEMLE